MKNVERFIFLKNKSKLMADKKYEPDYWTQFWDSLCRSIIDIESDCFQVKREGEDFPAWRERVYCYELYHQLRHHLPNGFSYTLHGEIDKLGHEIVCNAFKDEEIKKPNPDFVVHHPGTHENLAVVEVKSRVGISKDEVEKDLRKLEIFIDKVGYKHGIFLIYGSKKPCLEEKIITLRQKQLLSECKLHILCHDEVGKYHSINDLRA
jgi:hypothetical protein